MGAIELKAEVFSNPKKAKKIFGTLVQILESQQAQLETLADERNRQEERIKLEYERWISDVRFLKDLIDQLRRKTKLSEMARLVEAAKTNLVFGLKMKQELVYKLKSENLDDDLADFKEWFDILSHRCPTEKDASPETPHDSVVERVEQNRSSRSAGTSAVANCRALEKQVRTLKCDFEKLSVKNSSEVAALQAEKEFAWNQYKEMESKYTAQIQAKNDLLDQANARVSKLVKTVEQLHSSSMKKDAEIADLKASLAKMESDASKKDGQISRLLEESKSLKQPESRFLTPVLRGCSTGRKAKSVRSDNKLGSKSTTVSIFGTTTERHDKASTSNDGYGNRRKTTGSWKRKPSSSEVKASTSDDDYGNKRTATKSGKRELALSQAEDTRSEKKKRVAIEEETPRLFNSGFKIPKLKGSSASSHR